jgi:hypothetical protein
MESFPECRGWGILKKGDIMNRFFLIPLAVVLLAISILWINRLFLAPQLKEVRMGLEKKILPVQPAVLERWARFLPFRISQSIANVMDFEVFGFPLFLFSAFFPFLIRKTLARLQNRLGPEAALISLAGVCLVLLMFAVFDLGLTGLNAIILLPFAMKYGG